MATNLVVKLDGNVGRREIGKKKEKGWAGQRRVASDRKRRGIIMSQEDSSEGGTTKIHHRRIEPREG